MALNPDTLYQEANCYLCAGMTQAQALELALLRRQLLAVSPSADVSRDGLLQYAACYRCYSNGDTFTLLKLALLDQIAQAGGGSGACENLSGASSPLNAVTPDFVGQVFVQSDGTIWQAGSLLSSSWMVIGNTDGIILNAGGSVDFVNFNPSLGRGLDDVFGAAPVVTSFVYRGLQTTESIIFSDGAALGNANLVNLEFPDLQTLTSGDFDLSFCSALESVSAPVLTGIVGFFYTDGTAGAALAIELDLLQTCGSGFFIYNNASTAPLNLSLPAFVSSGSAFEITDSKLATFSAPNWVPDNGAGLLFTNNQLNEASVDHILARCVANAAYVTGTVNVSGGTNAPPGVQGAVDVITLTGRGCTVITN